MIWNVFSPNFLKIPGKFESMDRFTTKNSDTTHRVIGYAIGVLGLVVSGVVIYGVGGPLFPDKHLSKEDQRRGNYENFVPMIAS